jgi:hypothetical protein
MIIFEENININNKLKRVYNFILKKYFIKKIFYFIYLFFFLIFFCFFQPKSILPKNIHYIPENHQEVMVLIMLKKITYYN